MAAPNIAGVTTITGITTQKTLASTGPIVFVSNAAGSNRVYKINNITLTNISGSTVGLCTIKRHDAAGTIFSAPGAGVSVAMVSQIGISTGTALVAIDRASSFYLEEKASISIQCNVASIVDASVSFEIIE
jgi:hypothetical protein